MIDVHYLVELRKDCNRCYVVCESPQTSFVGYPCLSQPFANEKAILLLLPPHAAELYFLMQTTEPGKDHDLCGVLRDWLEEHAENVIHHNRESEQDVTAALDLLIAWLGNYFNNRK